VAEFVMVTLMLMTLFLALLGLGLWAYAHSLLTDAVGQAARYAANADVADAQTASARAAEIMSHTLAGGTADTVQCTAPQAVDAVMVEVRCTMAAPGLVPLLSGLLPDIDVTAHALREMP
jgi:hypothetical protein